MSERDRDKVYSSLKEALGKKKYYDCLARAIESKRIAGFKGLRLEELSRTDLYVLYGFADKILFHLNEQQRANEKVKAAILKTIVKNQVKKQKILDEKKPGNN